MDGLADRSAVARKNAATFAKDIPSRFADAFLAGDKVLVASRVRAVHIILGLCVASVAFAHYLGFLVGRQTCPRQGRRAHGYPPIEHIQLPLKIFVRILFHITHYASVELIYIFKSLLEQKAGGLLTAHSASADSKHGFTF